VTHDHTIIAVHILTTLKVEAARPSEMLLFCHKTTWRQSQEDLDSKDNTSA